MSRPLGRRTVYYEGANVCSRGHRLKKVGVYEVRKKKGAKVYIERRCRRCQLDDLMRCKAKKKRRKAA